MQSVRSEGLGSGEAVGVGPVRRDRVVVDRGRVKVAKVDKLLCEANVIEGGGYQWRSVSSWSFGVSC